MAGGINLRALRLRAHDFFFYVSQEQAAGLPSAWVHNTALLYAFNRDVPNVSRNTSGVIPHYQEDQPRFVRYVTPGTVVSRQNPIRLSWNAVDSAVVFRMDKDQAVPNKKLVVPKFGAYYRYVPYDTWIDVYVIGPPAPRVIRLGKKLAPMAVETVQEVQLPVQEGRFAAVHPVNVLDLRPDTELVEGQLCPLPPYPLYFPAVLEGTFLPWPSEGESEWPLGVALPDPDRFKGVLEW